MVTCRCRGHDRAPFGSRDAGRRIVVGGVLRTAHVTIARMTTAPGQFELHDQLQRLDPSERGAAARFLADHPPRAGAPVAVVIPAYNEEPTVGAVIGEVPEMTGGLRSEVIVVVDGARDQTAEQARGAGALVCDVPVNRGQGAALRLGYWLA